MAIWSVIYSEVFSFIYRFCGFGSGFGAFLTASGYETILAFVCSLSFFAISEIILFLASIIDRLDCLCLYSSSISIEVDGLVDAWPERISSLDTKFVREGAFVGPFFMAFFLSIDFVEILSLVPPLLGAVARAVLTYVEEVFGGKTKGPPLLDKDCFGLLKTAGSLFGFKFFADDNDELRLFMFLLG